MNILNKIKSDKYCSSKSIINLFVAIIILISFKYSFAQTYLTDGQQVPVFNPAFTSYTHRTVYWDLTEINNSNNRLDIGACVTQEDSLSTVYINGNWYKNEDNSNFNNEVTGNRFIYLENSSNVINGFIFRLNDSTGRKDAVVTRGSNEIEIYINSGGTIGALRQHFPVYGKILSTGLFSTDTLQDVIVLSNSEDTVKIYKGVANGKLDTIPYKYPVSDPYNISLAQLSSKIKPYSIIENTTGNRDELVYTTEDSLIVLKNSNSNTLERWISIYSGIEDADINIADINNDGYNDILVYAKSGGIKVYRNNSGEGFSSGYEYSGNVFAASTGDFNKDGWNDLVINTESTVEIYLNTKTGNYFNETPSYVYENTFPVPVKLYYGGRSMVADLYNKGGLAVIFSAIPDAINGNWNAEYVYRINAVDTDAVPAPAYLFQTKVLVNGIYHPKLLLFNRGDRDFLKYKIYKKGTYTNWTYALTDSTTNDYYIDTIEVLDTTYHQGEPASYNLYYYVKAEDDSYKVSSNSDTVKYLDVICPTCPTEPYDPGGDDRGIVSNTDNKNIPDNYSVNNFPNPFNPVTKINYSIPFEGNVRITIFNSLGQTVKELINEFKDAGNYSVQLDGSSLPSGIYYYKISSGSYEAVRKMVLIK